MLNENISSYFFWKVTIKKKKSCLIFTLFFSNWELFHHLPKPKKFFLFLENILLQQFLFSKKTQANLFLMTRSAQLLIKSVQLISSKLGLCLNTIL